MVHVTVYIHLYMTISKASKQEVAPKPKPSPGDDAHQDRCIYAFHSFCFLLSMQAALAEKALRRMCTPNKRGKIGVDPSVVEKFKAGGQSKKDLVALFVQCGRDKDSPTSFNVAV